MMMKYGVLLFWFAVGLENFVDAATHDIACDFPYSRGRTDAEEKQDRSQYTQLALALGSKLEQDCDQKLEASGAIIQIQSMKLSPEIVAYHNQIARCYANFQDLYVNKPGTKYHLRCWSHSSWTAFPADRELRKALYDGSEIVIPRKIKKIDRDDDGRDTDIIKDEYVAAAIYEAGREFCINFSKSATEESLRKQFISLINKHVAHYYARVKVSKFYKQKELSALDFEQESCDAVKDFVSKELKMDKLAGEKAAQQAIVFYKAGMRLIRDAQPWYLHSGRWLSKKWQGMSYALKGALVATGTLAITGLAWGLCRYKQWQPHFALSQWRSRV